MRAAIFFIAILVMVASCGQSSPTCACTGASCTCYLGTGSANRICGESCSDTWESVTCECGAVPDAGRDSQ